MAMGFMIAGLETFMQRCRGCSSILDYGSNTFFDKKMLVHKCKSCGELVE